MTTRHSFLNNMYFSIPNVDTFRNLHTWVHTDFDKLR